MRIKSLLNKKVYRFILQCQCSFFCTLIGYLGFKDLDFSMLGIAGLFPILLYLLEKDG